jgi:hemoglobin/transferrin/lactoferrin receptor protein
VKNISRIIVFVLFALIAARNGAESTAAELSGIVRDNETNQTLHGASVHVTELNTVAFTDENGTFSFEEIPEGSYTVRISYAGYAAEMKALRIPSEKLIFELIPAPFTVDEVVSTARGRKTSIKDIPGSVEILTSADFHETNPVSIPDALSRKPGLAVSSEMPWSSRVVIRGMTKDKIILLVDGSRVVTATATAAQFGTISNGDIERIELLKGPISVLYGSGSTGGVVNVITRTGRFTPEPRLNVSLNPAYESGANGLSMYERIGWSNSRIYITLSQSNRRYTDYYAADSERIPNSQFQDRQSQVNVGLKVTPHHTLEGRYQHFSVIDAGLPGGETFPPNATASYPSTSRSLVNIGWTWTPGNAWLKQSKISLYSQPVSREVKLLPNAPSIVKPHPADDTKSVRVTAMSIYPEADHLVHGGRWQNELTLQRHKIVAGIEGWQKKMESDRVRYIRSEIIEKDTGIPISDPATIIIRDTPVPTSIQRPIGIFAEDTFPVGQRLDVTVGARIDRIHTENESANVTYQPVSEELLWDSYDDDDTSWSFVAGGVFNVTKSVDLNLTFARSFRSPTLEERYLYADLGGVLSVGDPEIDSENGRFVEAGVSAELGSAKLNGQMFINSIDDMVILKPGGTLKGKTVDYQYANAGEARLWGFETGIDWIASSTLLISADVSYIRGTDEVGNVNLPSMPPAKLGISARYRFGELFWIEPFISLLGEQNKVAPGEQRTPGYGIIDFAMGKSLTTTGKLDHNVVVGIKNLGDKQYHDHLTISRGYKMYGMGRSLYISWQTSLN